MIFFLKLERLTLLSVPSANLRRKPCVTYFSVDRWYQVSGTLLRIYWKITKSIESEVIFGITKAVENALLKNHIIVISKQYIFRCRLNGSLPCKAVFNQYLKVYESESSIAKRKNKLQFHNEKWKKLMPYLSQI